MSKQPVLKFSLCPIEPHKGEEWEKIQKRKVGEEFTTFRGYTWKKHLYYEQKKGSVFNVLSNGKTVGEAELREVCVLRYGLYKVPKDDLRKDTFSDILDVPLFFSRLLIRFYGSPDIVLIKLIFEWTAIE